jgi:hypothetical protein
MANSVKIDSYPIKIRFAGWESDTYTLQRAGWQIAANQIPEPWNGGTSTQLVLRHEGAKLHAITNVSRISPFMHATSSRYAIDYSRELANAGLDVICMGSNMQTQVIPMPSGFSFQSFEAIDCEPRTVELEHVVLNDLKIFRPISSTAPEIIIPTHSVAEMMDLVLKLQDPAQKEIRERRRKEKMRGDWQEPGYDVHTDIKCQILAFG